MGCAGMRTPRRHLIVLAAAVDKGESDATRYRHSLALVISCTGVLPVTIYVAGHQFGIGFFDAQERQWGIHSIDYQASEAWRLRKAEALVH